MLKYIYLYCIYLLTSSSVLFHATMIQPFHPQPKKERGEEEYMTYGEHEALVRGKPSKLKLGSVFSFEMQSPTTFIPRGKDEKWEVY